MAGGGLNWAVPDFWDLWKAIAVALTGMFGVMGLLTNYKDKETGRITVWGKINMAGIVLSATMGVLSQLVDAQRKIVSSARSAQEAAASASLAAGTAAQARDAANGARVAADNTKRLIADLLKVSTETRRVALGTERSVANSRAAALAGQTAAARTLVVARGTAEAVTASKAGLVRVERLLSPFADPTVTLTASRADPSLCAARPKTIDVTLMVSRPQAMAPPAKTEGSLATTMGDIIDKGDFTSTVYHGQGKLETHLAETGRCSYELTAPLQADGNDLEVLSYLDLPGKQIIIYVDGLAMTKPDVSTVKVQTRDGQHFYVPPTVATAMDGLGSGQPGFGLIYTLPADRDPRSRTDTQSIF